MRFYPEQPKTFVRNLLTIFLFLIASAAMAQTPTVAVDDSVKMCEGTAQTINILLNDIDPDPGEVLEVDILAGPASSMIDYEDGDIEGEYTIFVDPGFSGEDAIVYEVCGDDDLCDIGVIVIIVGGEAGCVWPGDANVDSICNVIDLLPIGVFFGNNGPERPDEDGTWESSFCDEWANPGGYTISPNPKFADCNGDGLIDASDTLIIVNNYGQAHGTYIPEEFIGGPDAALLHLAFFTDTIESGSEVVIPIQLGSDATPATSIYGLAFQLEYDKSLIVPGSIRVTFNSGWLGTPGTDLLSLNSNDTTAGRLSVAVTRINQLAISGSGNIGEVSFVMEDNIAGKMLANFSTTMKFCIEQPLTINSSGDPIPVQVRCDSVIAYQITNDVNNFIQENILIFPNPASDQFQIKLPVELTGECELMNLYGQVIHTEKINSSLLNIKTNHLPSGTYTVMIKSENSVFTQKIIVQH